MLGLADRMRIFDLLESVLKGEAGEALSQCEALFIDGAEPARILIDLAETTHILTRKKIIDDRGAAALSEAERERVTQIAGKLSMPVLSRCWQMLVKGIDECAKAPNQIAAVEMILIRISYAADLPSPEELARAITGQVEGGAPAGGGAGRENNGPTPRSQDRSREQSKISNQGAPTMNEAAGSGAVMQAQTNAQPAAFQESADASISGFEDIADLIGRDGGLVLKIAFEENVRPVRFEQGTIEIALTKDAPRGLANDIKRLLNNSTDDNWMVVVCDQQGHETLHERKQRERQSELEEVKKHPLVKEALKRFPDARITDIRPINKNRSDKDR